MKKGVEEFQYAEGYCVRIPLPSSTICEQGMFVRQVGQIIFPVSVQPADPGRTVHSLIALPMFLVYLSRKTIIIYG